MLPTLELLGVEKILKDGVTAQDKFVGPDWRPHDIVTQVEQALRPQIEYHPLMMDFEMKMLGLIQQPKEESWATDEGMDVVYQMWRDFVLDQHLDKAEADSILKEIDKKWPELCEMGKQNPATGAWFNIFGARSLITFQFALDLKADLLAKIMLPAHFVYWTPTGKLSLIQPSDTIMVSCVAEGFYQHVRQRTKFTQEGLRRAKKILYLGGGYDASLWTRGFKATPDQQIVIFDSADCRADLEQLLNMTLDEAHIEYHVGDFNEAFEDPQYAEYFDYIVAMGVMPYYYGNMASILKKIKKVKTPDGTVVFDLMVKHLTYKYVGATLRLPTGLGVEESVVSAREKMQDVCKEAGLELLSDVSDPVCPAGICFTAK